MMNDDEARKLGMRPIEERVNGALDKGDAFDAQAAVWDIIKRASFKDQDEFESQIIEEVIRPAHDKIKGYRTEEDNEILIVIFHDSTFLWMKYETNEAGMPMIDIRSGYELNNHQVN